MGNVCELWEILFYIPANSGSSGKGQRGERESDLDEAEYMLILWQNSMKSANINSKQVSFLNDIKKKQLFWLLQY